MPFTPNTLTNPSAITSGGTHSGTAESESKNRLPKNKRFAVKNAAHTPTAHATTVERSAIESVYSAMRSMCVPPIESDSTLFASGAKLVTSGKNAAPSGSANAKITVPASAMLAALTLYSNARKNLCARETYPMRVLFSKNSGNRCDSFSDNRSIIRERF